MFIPNGKVDRQATDLLLLKKNIHGLVISASVAVNMERTKIQKLQIGNKIRLKSGEVGQTAIYFSSLLHVHFFYVK